MLCHWHFGSRWHSIYSSCCFTVFFCVGHLVVGFCFMLSRLHIHCLVFQFAFQLVLSGHGLDVSHVFYFTLT